MLLILEDRHKEHVGVLKDLPIEVVAEFCKISVDFISQGSNAKVYQTAAQKLSLEPDIVQHAIEGLMNLFTESSKLMLKEIDFHDSVMALGFSEELTKEILSHYVDNRTVIRKVLTEMVMNLPQYDNLEWRLEVQLASRTLRHQAEPIVLLKIHSTVGGKPHTTVLRTDPVNLLHLTQTLEEALQEMKMSHCRRIVRNI